jgi:ribosomal protein S16
MSKKNKFRFDAKIYNSYFYYKLRFVRYSRYQKVFYKLVVVNRYNTIVAHLGFYNPFLLGFRISYRKALKPFFFAKVVAINKMQVIYWLKKGAYPTPVVSIILNQMGLFKTHSFSRYDKCQEFYVKKRNGLSFLNEFLCTKLFSFNNKY